MVMVMVIMDKLKKPNKAILKAGLTKACTGFILFFGSLQEANAKIFDATLKPYFTVSQIYSDNLNLGGVANVGNSSAIGGFVTEISPSFSLIRNGPHSKYNVNYRLQFLAYEAGGWGPRFFNQLQMTSNTELIDNSLYIDSSSGISQINASPLGNFSPDTIIRSSAVPYVTYRTFRISPYWRVNYGGYVTGEVRATYYNFGNSIPNSTTTNSLGGYPSLNSNSHQESIDLRNGKRLTSLGWRLSLNNQVQYNQGATQPVLTDASIRFRAVNSEVSNRLGMYDLTFFVQSGYYDNHFPGDLTAHNGSYFTPGLSWTPSPKFQWAVGYGYNAYFTNLTWKPSQRTSLQFSFRNSQVGGSYIASTPYGIGGLSGSGNLNNSSNSINSLGQGFEMNSGASGGPLGSAVGGISYNGMFQHRTRTTSWTASYITTTSTMQQMLMNQSTFTTPTDINGNPTGDATANNINTTLNGLNNQVFVSKMARANLNWYLSKNTFGVGAFYNNYTNPAFNVKPTEIYGVDASWKWRFSQRMYATALFYWSHNSAINNGLSTVISGNTQYTNSSFSIGRQLSPDITLNLEYTNYHFQTTSPNALASGIAGNTNSNRITASIYIRF